MDRGFCPLVDLTSNEAPRSMRKFTTSPVLVADGEEKGGFSVQVSEVHLRSLKYKKIQDKTCFTPFDRRAIE